MKKHVVSTNGSKRDVDLTAPEIAARQAEATNNAARVAAEQSAQDLANKKAAALAALAEEQLETRGRDANAPQAVKDYLAVR